MIANGIVSEQTCKWAESFTCLDQPTMSLQPIKEACEAQALAVHAIKPAEHLRLHHKHGSSSSCSGHAAATLAAVSALTALHVQGLT